MVGRWWQLVGFPNAPPKALPPGDDARDHQPSRRIRACAACDGLESEYETLTARAEVRALLRAQECVAGHCQSEADAGSDDIPSEVAPGRIAMAREVPKFFAGAERERKRA